MPSKSFRIELEVVGLASTGRTEICYALLKYEYVYDKHKYITTIVSLLSTLKKRVFKNCKVQQIVKNNAGINLFINLVQVHVQPRRNELN